MRLCLRLSCALLLLSSLPGEVGAARPAVVTAAGRWQLAISRPAAGCRWFGHVVIKQQGSKLSGRGAARRVEGARCPSPLAGSISGSVNGRQVRFGFAFGPLGEAQFVGTLDPAGSGMTGSWTTRSASGTWAAAR